MTKLQKFSSFINRLIPPYARLCVLAVIAADLIAYYLPKALDANRSLHLISTALDDALPLVPAFILVYVLAYLQWVFAGVVIVRDSRAHCFRFVSSFILAMFLAMAVMLIWPTVMIRPAVEVRGPFTRLLALIYRIDEPSHIFPSMHCLFSWFCFRFSLGLKRMPRWYGWAQGAFSLLVFVSVVLVKQHVWPDIFGGIAAAELGILLSRLLGADRLVAKLDVFSEAHTVGVN